MLYIFFILQNFSFLLYFLSTRNALTTAQVSFTKGLDATSVLLTSQVSITKGLTSTNALTTAHFSTTKVLITTSGLTRAYVSFTKGSTTTALITTEVPTTKGFTALSVFNTSQVPTTKGVNATSPLTTAHLWATKGLSTKLALTTVQVSLNKSLTATNVLTTMQVPNTEGFTVKNTKTSKGLTATSPLTTPQVLTTKEIFDITCPNGWSAYGKYCYFFYSENATQPGKNWLDSLLSCLNIGGNLLSVADQAENSFIVNNLKKENMKNQRFWIGFNALQRTFVWSDNTASQFFNWTQGQPDNQLGTESCVVINSYGWNDHVCDSHFGFICKIKREAFFYVCSNGNYCFGSYCFGSYCYYFRGNVAHEGVDWQTALYLCKNMGGSLLSVTDQAENLFILNHLKSKNMKDQYFWIGLNALKRSFSWTDNTTPLFINWKNGEPDNFNGNEFCSEITTNGWNDIRCDNRFGFICKTKKGLANTNKKYEPGANGKQEYFLLSGYNNDKNDNHNQTLCNGVCTHFSKCINNKCHCLSNYLLINGKCTGL